MLVLMMAERWEHIELLIYILQNEPATYATVAYGSGRLNSTIVSIGFWGIPKAAHALFYFFNNFIANPLKQIEGLCDGFCSVEQRIQSDVVSNIGCLWSGMRPCIANICGQIFGSKKLAPCPEPQAVNPADRSKYSPVRLKKRLQYPQ